MSVNVEAVVEWSGSLEELIEVFTKNWCEDNPDCSSDGCIWIRHFRDSLFKVSDMECDYDDWSYEFNNVIADIRCISLWEVKK